MVESQWARRSKTAKCKMRWDPWVPTDLGIWGCPNNWGALWGVPIIRIVIFWGLYGGPLFEGNYHIKAVGFWVLGFLFGVQTAGDT